MPQSPGTNPLTEHQDERADTISDIPALQGHQLPLLVDKDGLEIAPQATVFSTPGEYAAVPSDEISSGVRRDVANPRLFYINEDNEQIEAVLNLHHKDKTALITHTYPSEWGIHLTDVLLGQLLADVHDIDSDDLLLFAIIMNEFPRHGAEGFPFGPEVIHRATRKFGEQRLSGGYGVVPPGTSWSPEYLVSLHKRLQRLARLAVYVPMGNINISGRYYNGPPFQGGSIINVGHPISFLTSLAGTRIPAEWYIQPGPVGHFLIRDFGLQGDRPQYGVYPREVFSLDLHHRDGAFRLALHTCQIWRTRVGQIKHGEMERTWIPRNLFVAAGIHLPINRQHYNRWLERRADDLDTLVQIGLLNSWEWVPEWAADLAFPSLNTRRNRGWFERLLNEARLIMIPS